jgi:hypothetical protein
MSNLTIEQYSDSPNGKTINVDTTSSGDVQAVVDLTYNIFQYIPEVLFVSVYALIMYAAVLWIGKKIKG